MYKLKFHKNLDEKKWNKFSKSQQIFMIANELNRAKNWLLRNNLKEVSNCYERAIELLDLTISVSKKILQKELLRFREIFTLQYTNLTNPQKLKNTSKQIKNYSMFYYL